MLPRVVTGAPLSPLRWRARHRLACSASISTCRRRSRPRWTRHWAPAGLSEKERATFDELSAYAKMGSRSYAVMMGTRPQTIGFAITDTPAGLAAWMLGHPGFTTWTYSSSDPEKSPDEVLDNISLY